MYTGIYAIKLLLVHQNNIQLIPHRKQTSCPSQTQENNPRLFSQPYETERYIYRVIQEESAILWEMIVCVILSKKVHMNMGPILDGYGVMTA